MNNIWHNHVDRYLNRKVNRFMLNKQNSWKRPIGQIIKICNLLAIIPYPTAQKILLEFKFRYFANGKFAKF